MLTDDKRRNSIIDSIQYLMKSIPCNKITVTDICDHAGISKSTFYKYFITKEDAFSYMFVSVNAVVMRAIPHILIADAPALQKYWSITRFFLERTVELGPEAVSYIARSGFFAEEHAFFKGKELYDPISDSLLLKAQKDGEARNDVTAPALHNLFQYYLAGINLDWSKRGGQFDFIPAVFQGMMEIFGAKPDFGPDAVLP